MKPKRKRLYTIIEIDLIERQCGSMSFGKRWRIRSRARLAVGASK